MRRRKRAKEKKDKQPDPVKDDDEDENPEEDSEISLVALFSPHVIVRASKKIRSFAWGSDSLGAKDTIQVGSNKLLFILYFLTCLLDHDSFVFQFAGSLYCSTFFKI